MENLKTILLRLTKFIGLELLIIVGLIFVINNVLVKNDVRIISDGIGYYDYLPALFIHHDLNRKDKSINQDAE